jgi:hypothetical protein
MTWTLQAGTVSINTEDDPLLIGFADNESNPKQYLLLQRGRSFDQQDRSLGQDTYYVEISGQDSSFYGGIASCILSSDQLIFCVASGNKHTQIEEIVVYLSVDRVVWEKLYNALKDLFEGTDVTVVAEA